jgi:hypothetical protein
VVVYSIFVLVACAFPTPASIPFFLWILHQYFPSNHRLLHVKPILAVMIYLAGPATLSVHSSAWVTMEHQICKTRTRRPSNKRQKLVARGKILFVVGRVMMRSKGHRAILRITGSLWSRTSSCHGRVHPCLRLICDSTVLPYLLHSLL